MGVTEAPTAPGSPPLPSAPTARPWQLGLRVGAVIWLLLALRIGTTGTLHGDNYCGTLFTGNNNPQACGTVLQAKAWQAGCLAIVALALAFWSSGYRDWRRFASIALDALAVGAGVLVIHRLWQYTGEAFCGSVMEHDGYLDHLTAAQRNGCLSKYHDQRISATIAGLIAVAAVVARGYLSTTVPDQRTSVQGDSS